MHRGFFRVSLAVIAVLTVAAYGSRVFAQCAGRWVPEFGYPGVNNQVFETALWDPDGPGPRQPVLVVGGNFTIAGNVVANGVATWDGDSWSALGTGFLQPFTTNSGIAYAFATLPNGDLLVGGSFSSAGGQSISNLARWNGTTWSAFGNPNYVVTALLVLANGDVIAGGQFDTIGGVPSRGVARWNGTSWSGMGTINVNITSRDIKGIRQLSNGDVVVCGRFNGTPGNNVSRWSGTAWVPLGTSPTYQLNAMGVMPNGDLVVGGTYSSGWTGPQYLATWNGSTWSGFGFGSNGNSSINDFVILPSGDIIASGCFSVAGGQYAEGIARWNGSAWSPMSYPGILQTCEAGSLTVMPNGDLIVGGRFNKVGDVPVANIAKWNGSSWSALSPGMNGFVSTLAVAPSGDVIAGGTFTTAGSALANRIARKRNGQWSALGPGFNDEVSQVDVAPNGDIFAGGAFLSSGSTAVWHVARWNGSAWQGLGNGSIGSIVQQVIATPTNGVVVVGYFNPTGTSFAPGVSRWEGTWGPVLPAPGGRLLVTPTGDLLAFAPDGVKRLNGASWEVIGPGLSEADPLGVFDARYLPNGDVLVAGGFSRSGDMQSIGGVARWNGIEYSRFGYGAGSYFYNQTVRCAALLPNGNIAAGGYFQEFIRQYSGNPIWSPVGTGVNAEVLAMATLPDGDLMVAGNFTTAGGAAAQSVARWTTRPICPANFNCSAGLEVADIFDFLAAWFALDARADFDGRPGLTPQDIFSFLNAWFVGC